MGRITRDTFIAEFGGPGATIDAEKLDAGTIASLRKVGIAPDELTALSGEDHQINSRDELDRLCDLIDRVESNNKLGSIDAKQSTSDRTETITPSGSVYEALRNEIDRGRLGAAMPRTQRLTATGLPSTEACQKSLAAIAQHGFKEVHLSPVPYFNQAAPPYGAHPYPKSPPVPGQHRTIQDAGCAPVGMAMINGHVRQELTTPISVADFAVQNKVSGSPDGRGTDTNGLARAWASQHGIPTTFASSADQSKNVDVLRAGLQKDGVALVSVGVDPRTGKGHFTNTGHVIVINGCAMKDGEEWFAVANPGRKDQTEPRGGLLTVDAHVVQIPGAENGAGRVWISRRQLEAEMKQCIVFHRPPATN